jgi:hypothetical protein
LSQLEKKSEINKVPVVAIAALLNLHEKEARYQQFTLNAVTCWLQSTTESLYQQALAIRVRQLGPDHPLTISIQENYTELLKNMRRKKKRPPVQHPTDTRGDSKTDSKTND